MFFQLAVGISALFSSLLVGANHPPTVDPNMPVFETFEYESTSPIDLKKWFTDPDGDKLHCKLLSPPALWLVFSNDCSFFIKNPERKDIGLHRFDIMIDDSKSFTTTKLPILIKKVVKPPYWTSSPVSGQTYSAYWDIVFSESVKPYAKDPLGQSLKFYKVSGPSWLYISEDGIVSGLPPEIAQGENKFIIRVCNEEPVCTDGTLLVKVRPGLQTDKFPIDTPVINAPAEYIWVVDNSDHVDTTIRALKKDIGIFYNDLDKAYIRHSGVYLSTDVMKYGARPIYDMGENMVMSWMDSGLVQSWRDRSDLAYSDGFCNNCKSTPIWSLFHFFELLMKDSQVSQIYHNGFYRPDVPIDVMIVTHQLDHYKDVTKNISALKNYGTDEFARDFTYFHRKDRKAFRFNVIAPECPTLLETSGDPTSTGDANTYRVLSVKTAGKYYSQACNFDAPKALHAWAKEIIFRAQVHAKVKVKLSKLPMDPTKIKVSIGGIQVQGGTGSALDRWSYSAGTNEIQLFWHLIDEGKLSPGDAILIEYLQQS